MTAPEPAEKPAKKRAKWRGPKVKMPADIWVLISAAFIVAIGFGIVAPVLPQFAHSFDLGVTATTIVVSSFAFFRLITAPAGGRLVNRFGERPIYVTGLLIVSASTFAVAAAQTYWQLLLFRALGGIGSTMFTVSAMALIVRIAPRNGRAKATGMYATAFLIGNIAGPVVGGLMAGLGMRVPFIIYGTGLVIAAIVVHIKLGANPEQRAKEREAEQPHEDAAELHEDAEKLAPETDGVSSSEQREHPNSVAPMRFREAWRHKSYRTALAGALANGWGSMGVRTALYPLFALYVLHVDVAAAGWALTLFAAGTAISVNTLGRAADVYGRKPIIITGFMILGATTIMLGYWQSFPVFLALSAVAGIGAGCVNGPQQAVVADIVGPDRPAGKVLSRFQMAMDTGVIFGPIVSGWLADAYGYSIGFAIAGVVVLLAGFLWFFAEETLPKEKQAA